MHPFFTFLADHLTWWIIVLICSVGLGFSVDNELKKRSTKRAKKEAETYHAIAVTGVTISSALITISVVLKISRYVLGL